MNLLSWNHACSVGIRAMDDQHAILMDAMNDLRLAVVRGSGGKEINELLNRLIAFTRMHFESEEQLMDKTAYPETALHRARHHEMLAEIDQAVARLKFGEGIDITSLLPLMREGFMAHIGDVDQKYTDWFHDHGIN